MPCTGLTLSTPSISCLDFLLNWDLSGAQPIVTITNNSTISNNAPLKWWFYVTSPSFTAIYGVDLNTLTIYPTPDVAGVAWTTKVINLPTPFGNPPCGQVEFSPNSPFTVTVFVQDGSNPLAGYAKTTILVRPGGNNSNSCGNFGQAAVSMQVDCQNRKINSFDSTILIYNNILAPLSTSNKWTLVYPQDNSGDIPNVIATNTPNAAFDVSVNSDGYVLYFQEFATYDYGNGVTVTVQYKLFDKNGNLGQNFAINCNTNLCILQCQMSKLRKMAKSSCGTLENGEAQSRLIQFTAIYSEILTGIFQPLCGIDVAGLIKEAQRVAGFDDNCDCGCGDNNSNNFGFSNPTPGTGPSGGCCPVTTSVINQDTGIAPAQCPQSYFPVQVKDPTGVSVIGTANDINGLIAILNSNPAWQAYGVAFAEGNCKIGWYASNGTGTIPNTQVILGTNNTNGTTTITTKLVTLGTTNPPPGCPTGNPYPVKVYDPTGISVIGIANSINDVVSIVNANAAWQVYGIASVGDNCSISWQAPNTTSTVTIPNTQVTSDTTSTTCVNGANIYTLSVTDVCLGTSVLASTSFPLNAYVDFGLGAGKVSLGNIVSWPALIAAYNTTPTKPAGITFSAGTVVGQVVVTNSNCTAYNGPLTLTADLGSEDFILYGGNHNQMIQSPPSFAAEEGFGLATGTLLGKIPGGPASNMRIWHTVTVGNYLLHSVTTLNAIGQVYVYDITNTLMPMLLWTIVLPDTGSGTCFTGVPYTNTIASSGPVPSLYGLYFPTDNPSAMFPTSVTVWESITGSGWKLDITTGTVVANYADQRLRNKCPRLILGTNILHTWDGDMGVTGGLSSGILSGQAVISNTSSFSSGTLAVQDVLNKYAPTTEYLWAATVDGAGTIWYVGSAGTLATAPGILGAVTFYANAFPVPSSRLNIKIFGGTIYASALAFAGKTTGTILLVTGSLPTITTLAFQNFTPPGSVVANNASHYNVLPLGNCIVAVTYDNHADTAHPQGGVALFKTDGSFIECIPVTGGDVYNVVAIGISGGVYVPNNLV